MALEQLGDNHPSQNAAEGIADGHDGNRQVATLDVRELRGDRVDCRQYTADTETGDDPKERQVQGTLGSRRAKHADRHHEHAPERRPASPDLVGNTPEHQRAQRHPDQFHGGHDAERTLLHAPFLVDAGQGIADRQHVEAVERVEPDGDDDRQDLQRAHRRLGQCFARIGIHRSNPPSGPRCIAGRRDVPGTCRK